MKPNQLLRGLGWLAALAGAMSGRAQITITASDMFNQVGQYYRAHAAAGDVDVSGMLGTPGGPQAWDFLNGPQDVVFRFDYRPVAETGYEADFPDARFAERKTDESIGAEAFLFLEQAAGKGRMNYGFVDPAFSETRPVSPFLPPIRDFPETMSLGDAWTAATTFESEIGIPDIGDPDDPDGGGVFGIPSLITYTASARVDAYGVVNQPGIGFGECLRVNELSQYDIAVDLGLGDGYQTIATQFVRNYYWLRKGRGIVVQITSKQLDVPPPDDFPVAAAMVRMFETNHPDGVVEVPTIKDLRLTLSNQGGLLTWTKASGVSSYRVEYIASAGTPWQTLQTTTANFVIDAAANQPGTPARLYRVVGLP
jgi:hypothetical protein